MLHIVRIQMRPYQWWASWNLARLLEWDSRQVWYLLVWPPAKASTARKIRYHCTRQFELIVSNDWTLKSNGLSIGRCKKISWIQLINDWRAILKATFQHIPWLPRTQCMGPRQSDCHFLSSVCSHYCLRCEVLLKLTWAHKCDQHIHCKEQHQIRPVRGDSPKMLIN